MERGAMNGFEYQKATDFDRAWLNFELDLPLKPAANGSTNPFYINRPENPINELVAALLAPFYRPPKFFFSGHRGCGKSTELQHLLNNSAIQKKYWAINFSIREETDIGSRLFREYRKKGGELPEQLLKELNGWKGKVEKQISTIQDSRVSGIELGASIDAFFANVGLKMKLEPATRVALRQIVETDSTGLIAIINHIAATIYSQEGRIPLILIDDMDKPDRDCARVIFHDHREIMLQPNCAIVYTVSSALFYSKEFDAVRDQALFLPNINLHTAGDVEHHLQEGYRTLETFVNVRVHTSLINPAALDEAITYSGGVFRELARIIRTAIGRARRRKAAQVESEDVEWAASEIRNEYRRILDKEDLKLLKKVHEHKKLEYSERLMPLLQLLAILEYRDQENWCDIHPALRKML
jgi:Cdc6-like AAA superfamily ATPase